jgi:hypothetical protein
VRSHAVTPNRPVFVKVVFAKTQSEKIMARSTVFSDFVRRAWWLYVAEATVMLAILLIIRAHT